MSAESYALEVRLLRQLRHAKCIVAKEGGFTGSLLIDFDQLYGADARGYREPAKSLVVESPWRLIIDQSLVAGSDDDSELINREVSKLEGHSLLSARVILPFFTLRLRFDGAIEFWAIPCDARSFETDDDGGSRWFITGRDIKEPAERRATSPSADPEALAARGLAQFELRRYRWALADFDRSLELRPDDPGTLAARGDTFAKMRRYDEALADYDRSHSLQSDDPIVLRQRGATLFHLAQYAEALADLDRTIALQPHDPTALHWRGAIFLRLRRYDAAFADLSRAITLRPESPSALRDRGLTYFRLERYGEALVDFSRSLLARPGDPLALYQRGATYFNLERYGEALTDFDHTLTLRPGWADTLRDRGITLFRLGRYQEAIADYARSLKLRPGHIGTLVDLSWVLLMIGDSDTAIQHLHQAFGIDAEAAATMIRADTDWAKFLDLPDVRALLAAGGAA